MNQASKITIGPWKETSFGSRK